MNGKNDCYDISRLMYWLKYFAQGEKSQEAPMARSKAKKLRDTIPMGDAELDGELSFLESRGYSGLKEAKKDAAIWYDALEIMDWLIKEDE